MICLPILQKARGLNKYNHNQGDFRPRPHPKLDSKGVCLISGEGQMARLLGANEFPFCSIATGPGYRLG